MSVDITTLERDRYDSMRRHDVVRLDELLAEEATYTHSNAKSDDKSTYLSKIANGTYIYHSISVTEEAVTVIGDTALARGRMRADVTVAGLRKTIDNRALAVWVRTSAKWRLVAYQPTVIPPS